MEARIYEAVTLEEDWGEVPFYRAIDIDVDTIADAVGVASKRSMDGDCDYYLVVVDGYESSPTPDIFTERVKEFCEDNLTTLV